MITAAQLTTGFPLQARQELQEVWKKVRLYNSLNRFDAAEKLLKSTLADCGPLANVHNWLGVTYHKQSKFLDALHEFHRALDINPGYIEAILNLSVTLCDLGRYEEAREVYKKITTHTNPKKKVPELALGRIANQHLAGARSYRECGLYNESVLEYKKALNLYPNMPDARLELAKVYMQLNQFDKAKFELEEAIKLSPNSAQLYNWSGVLALKLGRKDLAQLHWEKAQNMSPSDAISKAYLRMSKDWASNPAV